MLKRSSNTLDRMINKPIRILGLGSWWYYLLILVLPIDKWTKLQKSTTKKAVNPMVARIQDLKRQKETMFYPLDRFITAKIWHFRRYTASNYWISTNVNEDGNGSDEWIMAISVCESSSAEELSRYPAIWTVSCSRTKSPSDHCRTTYNCDCYSNCHPVRITRATLLENTYGHCGNKLARFKTKRDWKVVTSHTSLKGLHDCYLLDWQVNDFLQIFQ